MYTCHRKYINRGKELICKFRFYGIRNRCIYHRNKDYEYGRTKGNYNPHDSSPPLQRKISKAFGPDLKIFGLFSGKNVGYRKGEVITIYPANQNPSQYAIDFYSMFTGKNSPTIAGLTDPIEGYGMGSFINSPYNTKEKKNVYWKIEKGIIYIKALVFISYNTELLMRYGSGYPYNLMH